MYDSHDSQSINYDHYTPWMMDDVDYPQDTQKHVLCKKVDQFEETCLGDYMVHDIVFFYQTVYISCKETHRNHKSYNLMEKLFQEDHVLLTDAFSSTHFHNPNNDVFHSRMETIVHARLSIPSHSVRAPWVASKYVLE